MAQSDTVFAGSIPALYDRYLGPLIFAPYAARSGGAHRGRTGRAGSRNRCRHRDSDARAGGLAARRGRRSSRPISTSRCSISRRQRRASSACEWRQADATGAAVSGSLVECRRLPVRRDVFPRQGDGIPRGAARLEAGRPICVQRLGPHRGKRIHRCRDAMPSPRCFPRSAVVFSRARRTGITS